ncbi:MAG: D-Ala-D-Ala carboxypeptidase family metallohydrolase [Poseidonibacter sp.]
MTKNFKLEEFQCKCGCGEMRISPTVVMICQMVRNKFNKPVTITSGCRCMMHNAKVGGALNSQHKPKGDELSHAADIQVSGIDSLEVYKYLEDTFPDLLGLGLYNSWVHIDDRIDMAYRWNKRR